MLQSFMHNLTLFIHTFLTRKHAFEQGFLTLSTVILLVTTTTYIYRKPASKRTTQPQPCFLDYLTLLST
jgi:hypothetical protein